MNANGSSAPARILIVDDNPSIHRDFKLVLLDELVDGGLEAEEQRLFGGHPQASAAKSIYLLDDAFSGHEAVEKVKQALLEERPYQLAFVDIRMPGIDGVETISRMWALDGRLQVVICTAYSDYSWSDLTQRLGPTDKLLVLKKPFDTIEVVQLASTLTEKWNLAVQANLKLEQMELLVAQRTQKLLELLRRQDTELPNTNHQTVATGLTDESRGRNHDPDLAPDVPVVLLVEHDARFISDITHAFSPELKVIASARSKDAVALAQDTMPDIIVTEISGPDIDGIALCRQLKADELASHIPVLVLGSAGEQDSHIKALEAGADDCAVKPLTAPLVRARIEHLLRTRRRSLESWVPKGRPQPRDLAGNQMDAQFLRRAINTAERFLSDFEFDVDVFARKMAMSRRQLFRKLKAVAGCTPNSFIRTLRLNRAAHLLLHSQMTVTEITYAVGFSDLKHFRALFKECFGVLPGEFPAQHPAVRPETASS